MSTCRFAQQGQLSVPFIVIDLRWARAASVGGGVGQTLKHWTAIRAKLTEDSFRPTERTQER